MNPENNKSLSEKVEKPDFEKMADEFFRTRFFSSQPKACADFAEYYHNYHVSPLVVENRELKINLERVGKSNDHFKAERNQADSEIESLKQENEDLRKGIKEQEEVFCSMTSTKTGFSFWRKLQSELSELKKEREELRGSHDAAVEFGTDGLNEKNMELSAIRKDNEELLTVVKRIWHLRELITYEEPVSDKHIGEAEALALVMSKIESLLNTKHNKTST